MRTSVAPVFFSGLILFAVSLITSPASADVANVNWELNRQQGFGEFEKEKAEFNKERLSGVADVKKDREEWQKKQAGNIREYKLWKEHEGRTPDENSPEYREDQKKREEDRLAREKAREGYEKVESANHQELLRVHPLKECREYDLCTFDLGDKEFDSLRVPQKERLLYGNKPAYLNQEMAKASGGSSRLGGGASSEFPPAPPPPVAPSAPEFYEPEVPPPPPPPVMPEGGSFDEQIPPPIFDDPGY